jgi:hypothetical protein
MLKRLLSVGIALLGTAAGIIAFWIVFMPNFYIPGVADWQKLVLALLELGGAIYLFTRSRGWLTLLLLVGFLPMVLANVSFVGRNWRMHRYYSKSPPTDDSWLALLFPSSNEPSAINGVLGYSIYFSLICLPVVFFWFLFKAIHRRLANL